jgi:YHS domain-containing protein
MKTRKLVRRALFTAALSTASMMSNFTSSAFALDSGKPSSGIELVQYQPGPQAQNATQPAPSVEAELRKMFEESGQPMPSMRPQDLPNANVVPPSQMKPANGAAPAQNMNKQNNMGQTRMTNAGQSAAKSPSQPQMSNAQANNAQGNQPKKNFLQKFMGRVNGKDKKAAEASVVPPTPPGYQEPAPAPPADAPSGVAQNSNGQQMRPTNGQPSQNGGRMNPQNGMPQNRPAQNNGMQQNGMAKQNMSNGMQPNNGRPVPNGQAMNGNMPQVPNQLQNRTAAQATAKNRPQNSTQSRPGQPAASGQKSAASPNNGQMRTVRNVPPVPNKTASPVSDPGQPVPQVPFRQQTTTAANTPVVNSNASDAPKYVQPGNTPAFMSASQMTQSAGQPAAVSPAQTVNTQPTTAQTVAKPVVAQTPVAAPPVTQLPPVDDSFEAPFAEVEDANDVLDLDALELPADVQTPAVANVTPQQAAPTPQQPIEVAPTVRVPELADPAEPVTSDEPVFVQTQPAPVTTENPFAEESAAPAEPVAVEQNPFTGVRINDADTGLNSSIALPPVDDEDGDKEMIGEPAPPMEEFGNNLPAITLPPVDETESGVSQGPAELTIPNVEIPGVEIPPTEQPTQISSSTTTPNSTPAPIPTQGLDVTEPAPARSVDSERLQQTAEQERLLRQQRQIQSRAGQAGFKGFCPVTLRDKRELVDVNPAFTATFGLQTYSFASAEAKAAFEADPSRYAPAAGGSDIVLLVNSGEEQQGMLDYALWYRDRLYMFRSRETMATFNQDPQRFANQY